MVQKDGRFSRLYISIVLVMIITYWTIYQDSNEIIKEVWPKALGANEKENRWLIAISRIMVKPIPCPVSLVLKKGVISCGRTCSGIPPPSSVMVRQGGCCCNSTQMCPSSVTASMAFFRILSNDIAEFYTYLPNSFPFLRFSGTGW